MCCFELWKQIKASHSVSCHIQWSCIILVRSERNRTQGVVIAIALRNAFIHIYWYLDVNTHHRNGASPTPTLQPADDMMMVDPGG